MGFFDFFISKTTNMPDSSFKPTNIPGVNAKINAVTPATGINLSNSIFTNFLVDQATNVVTTYAIGLSLQIASKFMQSNKGQAAIRFLSSRVWNRFKYMFGFGATATTVHETSIDQKVFDQLFTPIVERVPLSVPGSTAQNLGLKALEAVKSAASPILTPPTSIPTGAVEPAPVEAVSPVVETMKNVITEAASTPEVVGSLWTFSNILMVAGFFVCSGLLVYYYVAPATANKIADVAMSTKKLEVTPNTVTKSQILNDVFNAKPPIRGGLDIVYKGMPCNVPAEYISILPKASWGGIDHARMDSVFKFAIDEKTKVAKIVGLADQNNINSGILKLSSDIGSTSSLDQKAEMVKQAKKGMENGMDTVPDLVNLLVDNITPGTGV